MGRALALARWQRAAGPYWPYVCTVPLLGPDLPRGPARLPRVPHALRRALAQVRSYDRVALFIDLPPIRSLPATPLLWEHGFHVVPVIQRWSAAPAILRSDLLLHCLLTYAPPAPWCPDLSRVAFVLDGDRVVGRHVRRPGPTTRQAPSVRRFDNRYSYPICRFPPPVLLQSRGITRVEWISASGIAPDMALYAESLSEAGLRPVVL